MARTTGVPAGVHPLAAWAKEIDRRCRFADLPAAIAYLEQGRARAKVGAEVA